MYSVVLAREIPGHILLPKKEAIFGTPAEQRDGYSAGFDESRGALGEALVAQRQRLGSQPGCGLWVGASLQKS